jgi:hypothetical protein
VWQCREHGRFERGAIVDATIDHQPTSMVLDLTNLKLMGATGLVPVSNEERRLAWRQLDVSPATDELSKLYMRARPFCCGASRSVSLLPEHIAIHENP